MSARAAAWTGPRPAPLFQMVMKLLTKRC